MNNSLYNNKYNRTYTHISGFLYFPVFGNLFYFKGGNLSITWNDPIKLVSDIF